MKPVVWSGCTGYKELVKLTIEKDNGEIVSIRCTKEHKIRLTDGTYKQANSLLPTDDIAEVQSWEN